MLHLLISRKRFIRYFITRKIVFLKKQYVYSTFYTTKEKETTGYNRLR